MKPNTFGYARMTISISKNNPGRNVKQASTNSPTAKSAPALKGDSGNVFNDPIVVKWVKEVSKI